MPIGSEPHYHLLLQNAVVRVYRLQLAPHEKTQPFTVEHDCIAETIQNGEPASRFDKVVASTFSPRDGPSKYARGPFTSVWENGTDEPYGNITIELLRQQGGVYNECVKVLGGEDLGCRMDIELGHNFIFGSKGDSGRVPVFKTDETNQVSLMVFPKKQASLDTRNDALLIFDMESEVTLENTVTKNLNPGDVLWIAAGSHLSVKNRSKLLDRVTVILFRSVSNT